MVSVVRNRKSRSKRTFLWSLIGTLCLLNLFVFGWFGYTLQRSRAQYVDAAATASQNMAHLLEHSIGDTFDKIGLSLQMAGDEVARQTGAGGIEPGELNGYLTRLHGHMPELASIQVVNADGVISYGLTPGFEREVSEADQWHFQFLRSHPDAGVVISDPMIDRVTGKPVVIVARRLQQADAGFAGVVTGKIDMNRFIEMFSSLDIGEKGSINLRDADLHVMLRYPAGPDAPYDRQNDAVSSNLKNALLSNGNIGTYSAVIPYDNITRTVSYRRIEGWPLYVLVGVAEDDYLADWRREAVNSTAMALFFLLASLVAARLLYRDWRARKNVTDELKRERKKFHSLASMSSDWFWEQDSQFRFTNITRNPVHWSSDSIDGLIGKSCWELESECEGESGQAKDALAEHKKRVEAHQPFENYEYCMRDEQGKSRIINLCGEPVFDRDGDFIGYHGVGKDITARREAENRERRLKTLYQAQSATNEAIIRAESEQALFPQVCHIAVEYGGMLLSWVGLPDPSGQFMPIASHGKAIGYLDELVVMATADSPEGLGPAGVAFRENRPVVFHDTATDETAAPWRDKAQKYGIQAGAAFPILMNDRPYAIWAVYSDMVGAFDDEIVRFLQEMTANISFAIHNFERERLRQKVQAALVESEDRLRKFYESRLMGVVYWHRNGKVTDANDKYLEMIGYTRAELEAGSIDWINLTAPEYRQVDENAILELQATGFNKTPFEKEYIRRDGSRIPIMMAGMMLDENIGVSFVIDVSERKKAEEELKLAAMVYHDSNEGMVVMDADNCIMSVNPAFESITGYSADEVIGRPASRLLSGTHDESFYESINQSLASKGYWKGELWSRRKNGQPFAIFITINTSFNPDGSFNKRLILFSDITRKKETDELLWTQANFDALTGLPNRNLFRDHLRQEIRKARRNNEQLALMFLDLDGFKDVNDTMGHDMGDLLLKQAAERVQNAVREIDTVARLGGDEFTVILAEVQDAGNVERIARNILRKLSEPFRLGNEIAHVSASIGITLFPDDANELEDLLKSADQAMYAAKQRGRNQYQYFTQSMQDAVQSRMRLVNDMRGALDSNQFEVVYQPIVDLSTGLIHKAEALIRWQHPARGMVNPAEFIPAAEDTGMINAFGDWVFHQAASQAAQWRARYHPDFQISVNISPMQFRKDGIDSTVWFDHLRKLGLPAQGIVVEITEGLLMEASASVTRQLLALRDAGIEVALDDFGTGYSSLSYLKRFDIDYLKIDQAFVRNLAPGSSDMALCEAIIVMAHKLGLKVVAEGVETENHRDLLANAECDYAQGYLYSGPLSAMELERLLSANRAATGENWMH